MKKMLLGLGTITAVAIPVAAVVSCDTTNEETKYFTQKDFIKNTKRGMKKDKEITRYFKAIFWGNKSVSGIACSTIEISEKEYKAEGKNNA